MTEALLGIIQAHPSLLVHVVSAFALPRMQEMVKRSKSPLAAWWNHHTDKTNYATSLLAALGVAGFSANFDGSLDAGGVLTISIPSMKAWMEVVLRWIIQFKMQQGEYHTNVKTKRAR